MERPSWDEYYLGIALAVARRSTCLRRQYGAVIVKNNTIISTGYNGAPSGSTNCCDIGECYRESHNIPHGERYELCKSVHAEANAIINADKERMKGATLYLAGIENGQELQSTGCCDMCRRMVINSGIAHVIVRQDGIPGRFFFLEE